jgi:hypothetical protein
MIVRSLALSKAEDLKGFGSVESCLKAKQDEFNENKEMGSLFSTPPILYD